MVLFLGDGRVLMLLQRVQLLESCHEAIKEVVEVPVSLVEGKDF